MENNSNLIDWLINTAPDTIYNFESDKITNLEKKSLLIKILTDSSNKQLPIYKLYIARKLGRYFQSKDTTEYILSQLNTNDNYYVTSNILHILREYNMFYNLESELKTVILNNISNYNYDEYIIMISIEILTNAFII